MKTKSILSVLPFLIVAAAAATGCGGDSADHGGSSSLGVVSCDITQAGLHYCEEAPGKPGTNTGCPTMMAGFVPGTGCTRTGASAICTTGDYKFILYTTGVAASTLSSICPGGTFEPVSGAGGGGSSTPASSAGACADLQACCNSATDATLKSSCLQSYTSAAASGDKTCAAYLPVYQLALSCK